MAIVDVPKKNIRLTDPGEIAAYLGGIGIDYERWDNIGEIGPDASDEEILDFYSPEIEALKAKGGYVTADVINVIPETPGLTKCSPSSTASTGTTKDEVRFIVKGHGLFHIAPTGGDIVSIEMEAGDLIRVPRGTLHWFNLCGDRTVRAIRLFQDVSGWTPHYTESGVDADTNRCASAFLTFRGDLNRRNTLKTRIVFLTLAFFVYFAVHPFMKAILLDIEGTTTPIDFVHETLFPYAKARVAGYVEDNFDQLRIELAELACGT
jgi:1,2-dihydroxy-3-keto-5-methylthiopentene dioxygenase